MPGMGALADLKLFEHGKVARAAQSRRAEPWGRCVILAVLQRKQTRRRANETVASRASCAARPAHVRLLPIVQVRALRWRCLARPKHRRSSYRGVPLRSVRDVLSVELRRAGPSADQVRTTIDISGGRVSTETCPPGVCGYEVGDRCPCQERAEYMTHIVYQTPRATVYHADALDILGTMLTESFDLVVTDPPYGVAFNSGFRGQRFGEIHNDGQADRDIVREALTECVRLVGQKRHLYVFGPTDVLDGLKVSQRADLVWDKGKTGMGNLSQPWGPQHEPITFAVSMNRHAGQAGNPSPAVRMRKGSVLRFNPPTGRKVRHPNEKPVGLCRELIESSSRIGDLVLDPFAGSGSTGVAAILAGRRVNLIESDEKWIPLICERLQEAEYVANQAEAV